MVSIGIMNTQINLRLSNQTLISAKDYSKRHGFSTVQEFIKETVREKLFEEPDISGEELELVNKLAIATEERNLYGTEEELFKRLKRR